MLEQLFVYGTLTPNRPNEHILTAIGGSWQEGTIKGNLQAKGWGAEMGYLGLILDEQGDDIKGFIFSSNNLINHWVELDKFECDEYVRVFVSVTTDKGQSTKAYVYTLK